MPTNHARTKCPNLCRVIWRTEIKPIAVTMNPPQTSIRSNQKREMKDEPVKAIAVKMIVRAIQATPRSNMTLRALNPVLFPLFQPEMMTTQSIKEAAA